MGAHFILLVGLPGAGKYTVSLELEKLLSEQGQRVCLVDSHLIADPIFKVVGADGITQLPARTFELATQLRAVVMTAIEELGIPDCTYIFTLFATEPEKPKADELVADLDRIAQIRGATLRCFRLVVETEELVRRAVSPSRSIGRQKLVNADKIRALGDEHVIYTPALGNPLTINSTDLQPIEVAQQILAAL